MQTKREISVGLRMGTGLGVEMIVEMIVGMMDSLSLSLLYARGRWKNCSRNVAGRYGRSYKHLLKRRLGQLRTTKTIALMLDLLTAD
jgi:hypothetical protein